jgi:hypothetical protein
MVGLELKIILAKADKLTGYSSVETDGNEGRERVLVLRISIARTPPSLPSHL